MKLRVSFLIKKLLFIFLVTAMFSCSLISDNSKVVNKTAVSTTRSLMNRQASVNPPGGLAVNQVPQFVTFGWDDNASPAGMEWSTDMMVGRVNPDGTPATVTYFNSSVYIDTWGGASPSLVKKAWRKAYDNGHEIGNHTRSHPHGNNYSVAQWNNEIDLCNSTLSLPFDVNEANTSPDNTKGIGVPISEIYGFRTPYLEYNDNLFQALTDKNMYDASIEEGFEYDQDGTNFFWPYTLDNNSPGHEVQVEWGSKAPLQEHPGLWEMPVYTVIVPPALRATMKARVSWFDEDGGKITGFDYNLWTSFKMTKAEYVATLKHTLDLRLEGNRAPMMLGCHTDYYASTYTSPGATYLERREAMEEFMDYAQSKPMVYVKSINKILDWVKAPSAIGPVVNHTVTPSAGENGSISPSTPQSVGEGTSITFTLDPNPGYVVDTVLANGQPADVSGNSVVVKNVMAPTSVVATFKVAPAGVSFIGTYYWTYNSVDEPVDMTTPQVDMKALTGEVLATVPQALAERISMEGSGFLPDGRLLNLANDSDWPGARFMLVNQTTAPWGFDAQGEALVPWRSLAADPNVIPTGTSVYVKEFDGITVPGGLVHDGWFVATDTSHSFSGYQVDFFVGTYQNYKDIDAFFNHKETFEVLFDGTIPVYKTITTPWGPKTVTEGGNITIDFPANPGYVVNEVKLDGVLQTVSGNSITITNVTADHTLTVTYVAQVEGLTAVYTKGTQWSTGFGAEVVITNTSSVAVDSWTVVMTFDGNQVISGWNGNYSQVGNVVTVTNVGWNGTIAPGGTVSFGMNGSYSGTNNDPVITVE